MALKLVRFLRSELLLILCSLRLVTDLMAVGAAWKKLKFSRFIFPVKKSSVEDFFYAAPPIHLSSQARE